MMLLAWVCSVALAGPLMMVAPEGSSIGTDLSGRWVPRGSTVQPAAHSCSAEQIPVTVLVVDSWYRKPGVTLARSGDTGCVSASSVRDAGRPDGDAREEMALRVSFSEHFGAIDASMIRSTPWDRVALPMQTELSESARREMFEREHLRTTDQQSRATDAIGPSRDGVPIYTHFLGTDAPRSDRWGTLKLVTTLLAVFDGWTRHCRGVLPATVSAARPETCTVQVGDLGWYSDLRPDPLGHRTHYKGNCADIRLFRDDGAAYEAWYNRADDRPEAVGGYSRELTRAFVEYVMEKHTPSVLFFNDPEIVSAVPGVESVPGHDDHIHMCF